MMMLYNGYQALEDMLAPARFGAELALGLREKIGPAADWPMSRRMFALMDVFQGAKLTHKRPAYGIDQVRSGNAVVAVREEVLLDLPFGNLLHFAKDDVETEQPRVLLVAPMSGHFATLLRATVTVSNPLRITFDGTGFAPDELAGRHADGHRGLALLRDLAADAGGSLTVRAAPGRGTDLELDTPAT